MLGTERTSSEKRPWQPFFVVALLFVQLFSFTASAMTLFWGEPPTPLPVDLTMVEATVMVPVSVVEHLGGSVALAGDTVVAQLGGDTLRFTAGQREADLNGTHLLLPAIPTTVEGDLRVPLRTLAEHLLHARLSFRAGDLYLLPWSGSVARLVVDGHSVEEAAEPAGEQVPGPTVAEFDAADHGGLPEELEEHQASASGSGVVSQDFGIEETGPNRSVDEEIVATTDLSPTPDVEPPLSYSIGAAPDDAERSDVPNDGSAVGFFSGEGTSSGADTLELEKSPGSQPVMTRYRRLGAPVSPRRALRIMGETPLRVAFELPPIRQTVLRAERLDWVEARMVDAPAGKDALYLVASKPFQHHAFLLTDPARLVIDITGLDTGHALEPLQVYGANVQKVRLSQNAPNVVRLVVDLAEPVGYSVHVSDNGREMTVVMNHILRNITTQFNALSGTVRLDVPAETEYRILRLSEPERLVIDLLDTTLAQGGTLPQLPDNGPIWNWRLQQFDASTTRLVFEIDRHLDIAPLPGEEHLTFQIGHQVRRVGYAPLGEMGLVLHIEGARLPDATIMYLVDPDRLVVDLPGTVLADPLQDVVIDQKLAWRIRSGQHPDRVRLVLDLNGSIEYEVLRLPGDRGLVVAVLPPTLAGKTVFLDPGHGGHDPGTMGRVLGLLEKDIVLDVALRLRSLLESVGATVYMSRKTDVFIPLTRRPAMAAEKGADLFLSIHANASASNYEAGGTETFIYTQLNHHDNPRLAQAIQKHLVSAVGLTDRGVKQANFAVLRHSFIPSALVEIAFLSRSEEELLLQEAWFRDMVAQGLFNGLVAYFNEGASRAADLNESERAQLEKRIDSALVNEAFIYLPVQGPGREGSAVGSVRVQPL